MPLEAAQTAKSIRKNEGEIGEQYFESGRAQQTASISRPEQDRVAVEWNPAHDQARARIPRVILPERQKAARAQRGMNFRQRRRSLVGRDVMKDAVGEYQIDVASGDVF